LDASVAARIVAPRPNITAGRIAADGPVSEDLTLVQRLEERFEKREDCGKQADAQNLGPIERIQFVRKCLQ
jgi:hypothetical protein